MNARHATLGCALLLGALGGLLAAPAAHAAARITIVNVDGPGEGFNDPTPVAPVGGNPGTTLGQQRLIASRFAADIWGSVLDSKVEILVQASFDPLSCTATSAVLGSAGTIWIIRDFLGTEFPQTWYHVALANKRAGFDLIPPEAVVPPQTANDLRARFNSNLGLPGCLTGVNWYYGLDNNHGPNIDLVAVLLHEFAHGLGFSQFASLTTGAMPQGFPDVYNRNLLDLTQGAAWPEMTNAQRVASAVNARRVVWNGAEVTARVPSVLSPGTPLLKVTAPAAIAGNYPVGPAAFGPPLSSPGIAGAVVQALDPADAAGPTTTDGCSPLTNPAAVAGNIALIDRGTCGFTVKVKNAQNAGAIAVIIADNVSGSPPAALGGADPTITIHSARITLADGNAIKAQLGAGVSATLGVDLAVRAGADPAGRALMHTPSPLQSGSSVSHWDPIASPNQLMEPFIAADLTHSVRPPQDLTHSQMLDIGWFPDADLDGVPDGVDCEPRSDLRATVVFRGCDSGVPNTLFPDGCTISDLIAHIAAGARIHGALVSGVAHLTERLVANGTITEEQKDAIMRCVGGSRRGTMPSAAAPDLPERFQIRLAGSNPARGGVNLELAAPVRAVVEIDVFDVGGRHVRRLAGGEFEPGRHDIRWDGRDAAGRSAEAGVFFVRTVTPSETELMRFVLIR